VFHLLCIQTHQLSFQVQQLFHESFQAVFLFLLQRYPIVIKEIYLSLILCLLFISVKMIDYVWDLAPFPFLKTIN